MSKLAMQNQAIAQHRLVYQNENREAVLCWNLMNVPISAHTSSQSRLLIAISPVHVRRSSLCLKYAGTAVIVHKTYSSHLHHALLFVS